MAKSIDPAVQAKIDKATAKAVATERKRVSKALAGMEMPEGTTARAAAAFKKAAKAAVA